MYSVCWVLQGHYFLCKLKNKCWRSTSTIADTSNTDLATLLPKDLLKRNKGQWGTRWCPKMVTKEDTQGFSFLKKRETIIISLDMQVYLGSQLKIFSHFEKSLTEVQNPLAAVKMIYPSWQTLWHAQVFDRIHNYFHIYF